MRHRALRVVTILAGASVLNVAPWAARAVVASSNLGSVVGEMTWCEPPTSTPSSSPTTTSVASSGYSVTTLAPTNNAPFPTLPAPGEATLVRREHTIARGPVHYSVWPRHLSTTSYNGQFVITGRFRLVAPPGTYLLTTSEFRRDITIRARHITLVRVTLRRC